MSNVAIDLTKTVKEIITTMKTAIDNLNTDVSSNKTAIDNLKGQILQAVYPVGSVYVSITDGRNPSAILGFGTWEALPAGYGIVAQGTATAEDGSKLTFTAGQKSGEFKHQITVGEMPVRTCLFYPNTTSSTIQGYAIVNAKSDSVVPGQWAYCNILDAKSYGFPDAQIDIGMRHNNVAPCISAYLWQRKT